MVGGDIIGLWSNRHIWHWTQKVFITTYRLPPFYDTILPHFATIVKDSLEGNVLYKGPRCRHRAQQSNAAFMDDNAIKKYAMTLPRINMVACKLGIHQAMRQVNTYNLTDTSLSLLFPSLVLLFLKFISNSKKANATFFAFSQRWTYFTISNSDLLASK